MLWPRNLKTVTPMATDQIALSNDDGETFSAREKTIAELWREVLQMSALPRLNDNFFALGGDSMTMTMLEYRVTEEIGVTPPPGSLLIAQSLREFLDLLKVK